VKGGPTRRGARTFGTDLNVQARGQPEARRLPQSYGRITFLLRKKKRNGDEGGGPMWGNRLGSNLSAYRQQKERGKKKQQLTRLLKVRIMNKP